MERLNDPPAWSSQTQALLGDVADLDLWQLATSLALAGYAVVPDVLPASEVSSLRSRAMELKGAPVCAADSVDENPGDLISLGPALLRFLRDERVNTLLEVVLGGGFALSSIRVQSVAVGAPASPSPLDHPLALPAVDGQALSACVTCCLNDWKAERGTVELVPGSHMVRQRPDWQANDMMSIDCPAGSVLVTNGNLWRRFGPYSGRGSLPSLALVAVHCRDFVSTRESYPDLAARLTTPGALTSAGPVGRSRRSAPPSGP